MRATVMAVLYARRQETEQAPPSQDPPVTPAQRFTIMAATKPPWTLASGFVLGSVPAVITSVAWNGLKDPGTVAAESAVYAASALAASVVSAGGFALFLRSKWAIHRSKNPTSELPPLLACIWGGFLAAGVAYKIAQALFVFRSSSFTSHGRPSDRPA